MNHEIFPTLLFGHLLGDYLFQNRKMAVNKSKSTPICLLHCTIYTLCVTATAWPIVHSWSWSIFIFLTHFPIDRFSLAGHWMKMLGSPTLEDFVTKSDDSIPNNVIVSKYLALQGGFAALVYAVCDNAMHLMLMYYGYFFFFDDGLAFSY